MGIRKKLNLLLAGLLVPLVGVAGLVTIALMEEVLLDEMKQRGLGMLSALSVPCSISLANHEIERLDDFLAQFRLDSWTTEAAGDPIRDLLYLTVVDDRGRVLAHTQETAFGSIRDDGFARAARASPKPLYQTLRHPHAPDTLAVAVPVESGLRWGTLLAEFSLAGLKTRTATMRWNLVAATLLLMLLTVLALSLGLSRLVVKPVASLSKVARKLGDGDLEQRVVEPGTNDELGTLARVFNSTAAQLASHTRSLEEQVRTRSLEIVEKNEELERSNKQLQLANKRLEEVATTDALTGLANKAHLLSRLEFEIMRAHRGGHKLSLMMMDVDHFKHYNDTHGHLAGDQVLARIGSILRENLRSIDIVGRFGGEEFCVAMLDTGRHSAQRAAEKICKTIAKAAFDGQDQQPGGNLTISIGVTALRRDEDTVSTLIERADQGLYTAKRNGRDRVEAS